MRNAVVQRGIKYLVHFTRVENLVSIFENGLVPVQTLRKRGMDFVYNDEYRFDNCENANCLSIQFPNYKMFYSYRNQFSEVDWVVLGIKREVLWVKDCAFCIENAASNTVTSIPLSLRKGVQAFNSLYEDYPGKPSRSTLGIASEMPTHPQAEVLVFDIIEPEYIWGVAFESSSELEKYKTLIPSDVKLQVVPKLFSYRIDYEYWR